LSLGLYRNIFASSEAEKQAMQVAGRFPDNEERLAKFAKKDSLYCIADSRPEQKAKLK
jgi:hypothetical protein